MILSAYIRLAEVGIGCDPWPDCYARLQLGEEKRGIAVLTPQGRDMQHYGARVAHRYIASVLGLFIVAIFLVSLRQGSSRSTGLLVPAAVLMITVFLSLLGYYTPNRGNPLITMGNLLGGIALLALLWWMMQREASAHTVGATSGRARPLAVVALCLVGLQVVLGGWSSANFASGSCPGLVHCKGGMPALTLAGDAYNPLRQVTVDPAGQVLGNESLALLSMGHRLFALLTAAYLAWMVRALAQHARLAGSLRAVSLFSICQVVAGVTGVWFDLPLWLVTLHNALAAGLVLACVNLLHQLSPATGSGPPR